VQSFEICTFRPQSVATIKGPARSVEAV